jgi:hypothetical protein
VHTNHARWLAHPAPLARSLARVPAWMLVPQGSEPSSRRSPARPADDAVSHPRPRTGCLLPVAYPIALWNVSGSGFSIRSSSLVVVFTKNARARVLSQRSSRVVRQRAPHWHVKKWIRVGVPGTCPQGMHNKAVFFSLGRKEDTEGGCLASLAGRTLRGGKAEPHNARPRAS